MDLKKIVVLIPAYNEEESIGEVISRVKKAVQCDVIVVDDGSTDRTSKVASEAGAFVVSHKRNLGLSRALRTGINWGLERGAEIFVNIDADGQYQPEEIPNLLDPILKGEADLVLGSRFAGKIEEMPWLKHFGNRMFTRLICMITGFPFSDTQTGFRAFTKELAINLFLQGRYTYTQDMLIQAVERGFAIGEVPIFFSKRKHGKSRLIVNPFSYALRSITIVMRTYRDFHPLKTFGIIGAIFTGSGFLLGSYLLYLWLKTGFIGRVPSLILTILLIILGVLSFIIGFLADMIKNVREEIRDSIKLLRFEIEKEESS